MRLNAGLDFNDALDQAIARVSKNWKGKPLPANYDIKKDPSCIQVCGGSVWAWPHRIMYVTFIALRQRIGDIVYGRKYPYYNFHIGNKENPPMWEEMCEGKQEA